MAIVRIPSESVVLEQPDAIKSFLARHGFATAPPHGDLQSDDGASQ